MKKFKLTLLALTVLFLSCDDKFDINRDPDNMSADGVALSTQFPAGIAGIAAAQGSYYALIGGFWSQYWTQSNASNQYKEIDNYSIGTIDYNGGWSSMYDALGDIRNVKKLALEEENWNYYLMATTLEVHASQIMADFYDQIPYSEANSNVILQPKFDSGIEVYDQMVVDLKDALSRDLTTSQGSAPGSDDFIFNGNMTEWKAFANTLLLKLYLRQTTARPSVAQDGITTLINSGVAFLNSDAAMTQFEDAPDRSNPLYETDRRQLNTKTNIRASTTMYSFMSDNNDSRKDEYYGPGNALNQGDYASTVAPPSISIVNISPTTAVYFMSREESLLIQAEALERYFSGNGSKALYDMAVEESFSKYGLSGSSYVSSGGVYEYPTGTFDEKLKSIITQKWISGFPGNGFEMFFEHNRTGYPQISSVPQSDSGYVSGEFAYSVNGTTGGQFPKRIVFPNTVLSRNQNAPSIVPLTTPVWWAQ